MRLKRLLSSPLLGLVAVSGCELFSGPEAPGSSWSVVPLDAEVKDAYSDFGFSLFRALSDADPDGNIFFSPTSAAIALSLTYHGTTGETAQEIAQVLGIEDLSPETIRETNRTWIQALQETGDPGAQLAIANSLWYDALEYSIAPTFDELIRMYYGASISPLTTPEAINDWVEEATRGAIDEIITEFPPRLVAYLINALYFKADWTTPFDEDLTREAPFRLQDGSTVDVPMMRLKTKLEVRSGDDMSMVRLPYGSGRFSMLLFLPDEGHGVDTVVDRLGAAEFGRWVDELVEIDDAEIVLPRFEVEWKSSLKDPLQGMGMTAAFDDAFADFSPMFGHRGPWVSDVFQKTLLKVDEKGTTAAAVTVVVIVDRAGSAPLVFDRPFVLAIYDHATETVLFIGQVTDPTGS